MVYKYLSSSQNKSPYKKFLHDLRNNKLQDHNHIKNKKTRKNQVYDRDLGIWFSKSKKHSKSRHKSRRKSRRKSRHKSRRSRGRKSRRNV